VSDYDQNQTYKVGGFYGLRRLRRVDDGYRRRPFVPYGIWPAMLLGLMALMVPFWAKHLERRAVSTAQKALDDKGFTWAKAEADGLWVTVRGTPPSDTERQASLEAVRTAKARTLFGNASPQINVTGEFSDRATPAPVSAPATPASASRNDWTFRVADGVLRLEGEVPDADTRNRISVAAEASRANGTFRNVINDLIVSNTPAPRGYASVSLTGLGAVSQCVNGRVSFLSTVLSVRCELPAAAEAAVRGMIPSTLEYGKIGNIDVVTTESIVSCETSLADILAFAKIEFASGKSDITPQSVDILNRVSAAASKCPGTLRIEGHTDNEGSAAINDSLSQRRAEAVRNALVQRGIPAERLVAEGFGFRNPIADNSTFDGRARNRRIEMRVVRND
jgi:outer membrane protein OmpA-like peptidoglycan-associated protein